VASGCSEYKDIIRVVGIEGFREHFLVFYLICFGRYYVLGVGADILA
jgi:hypothetical protein